MEFWKYFWMIAFAVGFFGFTYISYRVAVRGLAEARELLGQFKKDPK